VLLQRVGPNAPLEGLRAPTLRPVTTLGTAHEHAVSFYDSDAELIGELVAFVADGMQAGDGVVIVATPVHRAALEQALAQRGVALPAQRYLTLDAAGTLAGFRHDGHLDPAGFAAAAGALLDRAAAGGRAVRVFGEMVALLWDEGDVVGALELEACWNALARHRAFSLLCAYPSSILVDGTSLGRVGAVCSGHTSVVAPASYDNDVVVLGRPLGAAGRTETFVPVPASVRMARRFVTCTLQAWRMEGLRGDAELLISELATCALQRAGSPFRVELGRAGQGLRITVVELGQERPRVHALDEEAFGGRGTALVDLVADRSGTAADAAGTVLWAELGSR
jgi:hypothetical protein